MTENLIPLTLEFGGGAELLFKNKKKHDVKIEFKEGTLRDLLVWMKDNLIDERPELFFQGESVRPGILVLINETDWELLGQLTYKIQANDKIMFISTLHGG